MEKIFNDRWWDYSNNFGNINGRVCLFNSLCFGVGALLINYLFHLLISKGILLLSNNVLIIISIICFIAILTDFIITTNLTVKFKQEIKTVKNYFDELKLTKIELLDSKLIKRLEKYKKIPKHFMNAYPDINKKYILKKLKI